MAKNAVILKFLGDTTSLEASFKRIDKSANETSSGGLKKVGTAAKLLAGGALGGLAAALKTGYDEMNDGLRVSAQTAAALKSTGGAAGLTQKQIEGLAGAISNKSGLDDQAVQSGENLLLTFTNLRDAAGKGNDIFTQSTKIMADMSVALGQDTKSSALQLGKALNDPIKGVTALQRVGVSFTADQKKQIKALVASGQTMKAQKLILGELNKEFGGSAAAAGKTLPGQLNILKNTFANVAADLVSALLPAIDKFVSLVKDATDWAGRHETAVKVLAIGIGGLAVAVLTVNKAVGAFKSIQTAATAISKLFVTQTAIATTATEGETVAQKGMNTAMRANPIGLVVTALVLLGTALYEAWQHSQTFRDVVTGAFDAVKTAAKVIVDFFRVDVVGAFQAVIGWLRGNWQAIATIISGPFAPLVALATNAFGIRSAMIGAFNAVKHAIGTAIDDIVGFVTGIPGKIAKGVKGMWDALKEGLSPVVGAIRTLLSPIVTLIDGISSAIEKIKGFFSSNDTKADMTNLNRNLRGHGDVVGRGSNTVLTGGSTGGGNIQTTVTKHALGGVFSTPHIGMVAEAGPEAIVPLGNPGRAAQVMRQAGIGGGNSYSIVVNALDARGAATAVVRAIDEFERRNGRRYVRA